MMVLTLLLAGAALQDRAPLVPGPDDPPARLTEPNRCVRDPNEIKVCAESQAQYRVQDLAPRYVEKPVRAAVALPGGGEARAYADQRAMGGGVSVPSAMFSVRLPFGKGKKKAEEPK